MIKVAPESAPGPTPANSVLSTPESAGRRGWGWPVDLLICLGLAGVSLIFYWRFMGIGRTQLAYTYSDFAAILWPFRDFNAQEWLSGRVPLWNNAIFGGQPHLASLLPGVFYPLAIVDVLLHGRGEVMTGIYVRIWLDSVVGAAGMYFLVRRWTGNRTAATLSAVALSLGGFATGFGDVQLYLSETLMWMPWCLIFLDRSLAAGRWQPLLLQAWLAGWAFGFSLLAGYPQMGLVFLPAPVGLLLVRLFNGPRRGWTISAGVAFAVSIFSISAVQSLPALEFFRLSERSGNGGNGAGYALAQLAGLLIPGMDSDKGMYVGLLPLLFAIAALFLRRRQAAFWGVMALLGVLFALGDSTPLYNAVFSRIGFDLFRGQSRNIGLAVLALAILAGLGLAALPRRPLFSWLSWGAVLVTLANLGIVNWENNWPESYQPRNELVPKTVAILQQDNRREPMRYQVDPQILLPPDEAHRTGLESLNGDINFTIKRTFDIQQTQDFWRQWELFNVRFAVTNRDLNGDGLQLVPGTEPTVKLYKMLYPLPRAYVVWESQVVAGEQEAFKAVRDGSLKLGERVVLEEPLAQPLRPPSDKSQSIDVKIVNPQEVTISTGTRGDGFLVLSYAYYPGWKAEIDGAPARLQRADFALEGLALPAGTHTVRLHYEPDSFRLGAAISLASLLVGALLGTLALIGSLRLGTKPLSPNPRR